MEKYPLLRGLANFAATVGWVLIVVGTTAFVIGAIAFAGTFQPHPPTSPDLILKSFFVMIGGAFALVFGLPLAMAGEIIKVHIDTEKNTAQIVVHLQSLSGDRTALQRSELQLPEPVAAVEEPVVPAEEETPLPIVRAIPDTYQRMRR